MLERAIPEILGWENKKAWEKQSDADARGVVIVMIRSSWEIVSLLGIFSWAG